MELFQILQSRNLKYLKLIKKTSLKITKYLLKKSYQIINNCLDMILKSHIFGVIKLL